MKLLGVRINDVCDFVRKVNEKAAYRWSVLRVCPRHCPLHLWPNPSLQFDGTVERLSPRSTLYDVVEIIRVAPFSVFFVFSCFFALTMAGVATGRKFILTPTSSHRLTSFPKRINRSM